MAEMPLQQLDFLYTPSRDVASDLVYFTEVLGGRMVFAVDAMGTRVAAVRLTADPPLVLLADHVEGERPILVYRVADLGAALAGLEARGWQRQRTLEIPYGPCCSFRTPGGHRIALYQLTRPEVVTHSMGGGISERSCPSTRAPCLFPGLIVSLWSSVGRRPAPTKRTPLAEPQSSPVRNSRKSSWDVRLSGW